jgi:beta-glucosidase
LSTQVYQDAKVATADRVDDLLSRMTLDEKIAQVGSAWVYELLSGTHFAPEKAEKLLKNGIGHITRVGGASNVGPNESLRLANEIQKFLLEKTRLGIPAIVHEECCSGYMALTATAFPQAIGLASAWEPELVTAVADVIRTQMRSVGAHHALAPVLDVARDARWGRVEETFGEDPFLIAQTGVAYVRGLQGDDLKTGIIATGKHFVGYSMSEGGMNWAPAHLGWRELREVYLYPFEAVVREAHLGSIMNAYHELDGVPCAMSHELLTEILRDEWGFDGTVVSDYFAINSLSNYHHIQGGKSVSAGLALEAGLDIELPSTNCFGDPLYQALEEGKVSEAVLDTAVRRVLTQKFALGLFDSPYVDTAPIIYNTPEQIALARQAVQKSIVLLKNEADILPLGPNVKSIAVIGPNADSVRNLFGDYAYVSHFEMMLENRANDFSNLFEMPIPDHIEKAEHTTPAISILAALREYVGTAVDVQYAKGCDILDPSTTGFAEAIATARSAELAIVVVGDKAGLGLDCTSGESRDRADLNLPGVQEQLVQAVCETGTPVILVLITGRPVILNGLADSVQAIVEAWLPADEGAHAIVDVLFGAANPGGKLPISFPRSVGQVPLFYGHRPSGGRSHWHENYVEVSVQPQYPFGFGLSYTRFAVSNIRLSADTARAGEHVTIQVDVRNVGARAGDEVVQLYTHQNASNVTRPLKELKGYKRVTLEPGQTKTITFGLHVNQLAFYDREKRYVVEPGLVDVLIGTSSRDIHCTGQFSIQGEATDVHDQKVFFASTDSN